MYLQAMDKRAYLKKAQSIMLRVMSVIDSRIGDIYNNESLMLLNEDKKASYSLRLAMKRGYDEDELLEVYNDKEEGLVPLETELEQLYTEIDYEYKSQKRFQILDSFIKRDAFLDEKAINAIATLFMNLENESKTAIVDSATSGIERIAYIYKGALKAVECSFFPNMALYARLDLYIRLLNLDDRFTGLNYEEAMFIRRQEHNDALSDEGHERLTAFLAECLLDASIRAADDLVSLKNNGQYATLFLSSKMEKGKTYDIEDLASLFGISSDMLKSLILIPALSSDAVSIGENERGDETITLLL